MSMSLYHRGHRVKKRNARSCSSASSASQILVAVALLALMIGCGDAQRNQSNVEVIAGAPEPSEVTPAPTDSQKVVLFVGTSLTAGYGLSPEQAYPTLIQQKIES